MSATSNGLEKQTSERRKEIARSGGNARAKHMRERKTLKEELLAILSDGDIQERLSLALIDEALNGRNRAKAYETIRATIGEDAPQKVEVESNTINITIDGED